MHYGRKLKELLREKEVKQKELSNLLQIPETTISGWTKRPYLQLENIEIVCEALDMKIWEFFISKEELSEHYKISIECLDLAREIDNLQTEKKNKYIKHMISGLDLLR